MNKWQKLGLAVGMGTAVVTTSHIINKFIFESATINNYTGKTVKHTYSWKFGNIAYSTYGNYDNPPLLLIHDLKSYSSGYEWDNTVHYLSKKHHLYVVDLLGCGHSDKPQITYTTYMYTQLLNDFITNVIGKKTDIIATGDSAPMVISSVYIKKDLYNKIILVSPKAVSKAKAVPGRRAGIRRRLLDIPVIGTTIYNICMRKDRLNNILSKNVFDNGIVPVDDRYLLHIYISVQTYILSALRTDPVRFPEWTEEIPHHFQVSVQNQSAPVYMDVSDLQKVPAQALLLQFGRHT